MTQAANEMKAHGRGTIWDYAKVLTVIGLVTLGGRFTPLNYNALGYVYLLAVIALSLNISRWPSLAAAVLSGLAWDFFFVPPVLSFSGIHFTEGLLLATYFIVALIGSQIAALRSAADRAELLAESERLHRTLLDCVSHELITPIAVFRSAVEQLGTSDPVKRQSLMTELHIALRRLDNLAGNLLNQTRLETGMLQAKLDWCDCRELVASARRDVGAQLEGHTVVVEIPADFPIFLADADLMEQAITQLLRNAAFHTPKGTRIRVSAKLREEARQASISVADDGPGIPDDLRASIFDKFSRGPNSRAGGLGLGLSIVRGFMLAQGGDALIDSAPEGGARFTLVLPFAGCETAPGE